MATPAELFPASQNFITLPGPAGKLQTVVAPPLAPRAQPALAIICHPHPLHEGTMHNKVVTTLARTFAELGLWTIRFNFRGVGESEGSYGEGIGETEDALTVLSWAQKNFPDYAIWFAGFSFGSYVALQATLKTPSIQQLITIAPAVNHFEYLDPQVHCRWILVMGEEDEIVPVAEVKQWLTTLSHPPVSIFMPETSHFFHGKLVFLREELKKLLFKGSYLHI